MRIQHNIMAMNAFRNYNTNTNALGRNLEKLSSGYKINRAGDDAAGLAISEKMRAQISGLKQAQSNVKDGISLVKTAEGALQEVQDMLNRMTTLATQSANGTYDKEVDRNNLQKEVDSLKSEINRIADASNFNGTKLLNGGLKVTETAQAITGTVAGGTIDIDSTTNLSAATFADGDSVTINGNTYTYAAAPDAANGEFSTYEELKNLAAQDGLTLDNEAKTSAKAAVETEEGSDGTVTKASAKISFAGVEDLESTKTYKLTFSDGTNNVDLETDALAGNTVEDLVDAIVAKGTVTIDSKAYTITKDGTTGIKIEATTNAGAALASVAIAKGTTAAPTNAPGGTAPAVSDATKGAAAVATAGYATVTFDTTKTGADYLGSTVTVDGKTYEFVTDADAAGTGNVAVVIAEADTAAQLATKLQGKAATTGNFGTNVAAGSNITVGSGATANVVTFTHNATGAGKDIAGTSDDVETNGTTATYSEGGLTLQIGDTADVYNKMTVKIGNMHTDSMGTINKTTGAVTKSIKDIDISDQTKAADAIQVIKDAINYVSGVRGDLGAVQNRLEHTTNNLAIMTENIQDAESTIRDVDIADEMTAYTKNNILLQSAQAMLAQANQMPQGVLQLLQ